MFAVIYIRNFSLQAVLRLHPELRGTCVALADASLPKSLIFQQTESAGRHGVEAGLTPSQAAARCPQLIVKSRDVACEQSCTEMLLQSAYAFSPCIEATAPGICTIDLKGLGLDEETTACAWAEKLCATLEKFNLEAQIGFGPNASVAQIIAQAAKPILWLEESRQFVLTLPIATLNPNSEMLQILAMWGIQTVGAFIGLGKNQIAERLGTEALDLFEALEEQRPLRMVIPPENFIERMEFQYEIETTEPLLFALNRFLQQLIARLDAVFLVVAELHLELALSSGEKYRHVFKIPSPTNQLPVLFRMVQTHLENVRTDSPIIGLEVRAIPGRAARHQFGLFEASLSNPNQFAETLARLTALCGAENVGTPEPLESFRPDAFRIKSPDFSITNDQPSDQVVSCRQGPQLRRFRPAHSAQVEFRSHRPALIRSRHCNGAVTALHGPFTSSGDWWEKSRHWNRAEWDVAMSDGKLYRIYSSDDGCFVEGVYD